MTGRQYSLFTPPDPCPHCTRGHTHDPETGHDIPCTRCGGTGLKTDPCITQGCDQPAVNGPWCPDHDPATCEFPY